MPFPLPIDPDFMKEVVLAWLEDVDERLLHGRPEDAEISWKEAVGLYLKLGPGEYSPEIDKLIVDARVKLDQIPSS